LHRLELRCLGRRTEARMINLDQDLDLLIALEPDSTRPGRSIAPAGGAAAGGKLGPASKRLAEAPQAAAPATAAPGTLSHKKTDSARPIDDADPYAN